MHFLLLKRPENLLILLIEEVEGKSILINDFCVLLREPTLQSSSISFLSWELLRKRGRLWFLRPTPRVFWNLNGCLIRGDNFLFVSFYTKVISTVAYFATIFHGVILIMFLIIFIVVAVSQSIWIPESIISTAAKPWVCCSI